MPYKNPEDKRRYYQERGPAYRAEKAAQIKARQRAWYQANKERLRVKEREAYQAEKSSGALLALTVAAQQ